MSRKKPIEGSQDIPQRIRVARARDYKYVIFTYAIFGEVLVISDTSVRRPPRRERNKKTKGK